MVNKVFLNDQNIIECQVVGDQTAETVTSMGRQISKLLEELKSRHHSLLILDDITHMGEVPAEGRKIVVSFAKTLPYDRVAMLGSNGLMRLGANLIIRAAGRAKKLRYFTERTQAIQWLHSARA